MAKFSDAFGTVDDLLNVIDGMGFFNARTFPMDIKETDTGFIFEAEVPGFAIENIDIQYENDLMTITCSKESCKEESKSKYRMRERKFGKLQRALSVPSINEKSIEASLKNGILTVKMSKAAPESNKTKVNVKAG